MSSSSQARGKLPFLQRLRVSIGFLGLVFAVLPKIFSRANKNRGWARAVSDSGTRVFVTSGWNIWHMAYAMGGTATPIYVKWAKQNKLKVLSDDIGEGAKLHWVGPQRFDRVFLFFHGGGFSLPPSGPEQLNFLYQVQRDLQVSVGGAGVAFLEYSLTPDYLFPTQLCQANAAVLYLISKGCKPANIVIGGDSAGGNLALQLASHILHPHPDIPAPPDAAKSFRRRLAHFSLGHI